MAKELRDICRYNLGLDTGPLAKKIGVLPRYMTMSFWRPRAARKANKSGAKRK